MLQIGAVLVSKDGKVLGRGRNKRVQESNNILHVSETVLSKWSHWTVQLKWRYPGRDFGTAERRTSVARGLSRGHHVYYALPL